MMLLQLCSVDENTLAPLASQRPGCPEAKEQLRNFLEKSEKRTISSFPVSDKKRLYDNIDPSLQGFFAKAEH